MDQRIGQQHTTVKVKNLLFYRWKITRSEKLNDMLQSCLISDRIGLAMPGPCHHPVLPRWCLLLFSFVILLYFLHQFAWKTTSQGKSWDFSFLWTWATLTTCLQVSTPLVHTYLMICHSDLSCTLIICVFFTFFFIGNNYNVII